MRSSVGQCRNIRFRQLYASHVIITSDNADKIRHIDEHMHAFLASAIGRHFSGRYSNYCFNSEPYYSGTVELEREQILSCTVISCCRVTGGKSTAEGGGGRLCDKPV